MYKKSQAALEFLATYGWAFLVILVVIAALSYFGILSPSKLLPDRCSFSSEFGCRDYTIGNDGVSLKLSNNVGQPIIIDSVTVSTESTPLTCSSPVVGSVWRSGEVKEVPVSCNLANSGLVAGEKGKLNLKIKYHNVMSSSAFAKDVNGEVFAIVQDEDVTWTRVVFEDFETPTSGWSATNTITSCGSYGNILGGYNVISTQANSKTYNLLNIPHTQARLSLDYIKIDSWDNEQAIVKFGGNEIFRHTYCFCSQSCQNSGGTCGGDAVCGGGWNEERKIPVTGTISHTGNTIEVYGASTIDQAPSDESWGIDNVQIFVR